MEICQLFSALKSSCFLFINTTIKHARGIYIFLPSSQILVDFDLRF